MMTMEQPMVGKRFRPEDKFLIELLQFKATGGGDISGCTEHPEDLCYWKIYGPGKEPWKLFSGESEIVELHEVNKRYLKEKYLLTDLTKIGRKNVRRTAGAGTWDDQNTSRPVVYGGHEMGYWKTLTYEYWGDDDVADKPYYYMNELHLSEYALTQVRAKRNDYVICRVLKNESKCCRIRRGKKRVSQDQDDDCPVASKKKKPNQASCSQVVLEEEPEDDDDLGECIDFPDDFCELLQNQPQEASSFASDDYPVMQGNCSSEGNCHPQLLSVPEYLGPAYVPEMQPTWAPSCSNLTMPDEDFFAEEWNFENLDEIMNILNA